MSTALTDGLILAALAVVLVVTHMIARSHPKVSAGLEQPDELPDPDRRPLDPAGEP